jgi:thiamine transport system substrate-binding protein
MILPPAPPARRRRHWRRLAPFAATAVLLVACSGDDDGSTSTSAGAGTTATTAGMPASDVTLTLLAYDSFTPSEGIFDEFTASTGIRVEIAQGGDAGEMVSKAVLTAGNPEGDVMWGVDNALLSRAIDGDVFVPYESPALADVPAELTGLAPGHEVTPVDYGDVCVNYDIAALEADGIAPPESLDDLTDARFKDKLVVENPVTSSPGLAFLLATIGAKGDGWQDYWSALRDNGVMVVDDWDAAYYAEFTRAGGNRPLVVSYASSPPVEVLYADPPLPEDAPAPTGVAAGTCFRQVEFAGVLRGTEHEAEAQQLVDYLLGPTFQADMPLTLFVYPANATVALPDLFEQHATPITEPYTVSPADIAANRQQWIDDWTTTVLR